jgi:hypothetical protein
VSSSPNLFHILFRSGWEDRRCCDENELTCSGNMRLCLEQVPAQGSTTKVRLLMMTRTLNLSNATQVNLPALSLPNPPPQTTPSSPPPLPRHQQECQSTSPPELPQEGTPNRLPATLRPATLHKVIPHPRPDSHRRRRTGTRVIPRRRMGFSSSSMAVPRRLLPRLSGWGSMALLHRVRSENVVLSRSSICEWGCIHAIMK